MRFKEGVSIRGIQPEMLIALELAEPFYKNRLLEMVVTSVTDGKHKEGSLHYKGLAVDLRTKGTGLARSLTIDVRKALKPLGFDVLLEAEGEDDEHMHLEFDIKNLTKGVQ
jgi:hypothetical protein